jgi:hypothetical protein
VFYDPMESQPMFGLPSGPAGTANARQRPATVTDPKQIPRERLRAQVRDFIVWLKAQGVL